MYTTTKIIWISIDEGIVLFSLKGGGYKIQKEIFFEDELRIKHKKEKSAGFTYMDFK